MKYRLQIEFEANDDPEAREMAVDAMEEIAWLGLDCKLHRMNTDKAPEPIDINVGPTLS